MAGSSIPTIGSVMTEAPLAIDIDAKVRDAEDLMEDHGIRHLPVTDRGRAVGVLSDRDVAFMENGPISDLADRLRVRDVCALSLYAVEEAAPLDVVAADMAERRIGSAVVLRGDKIIGIFTTTDACRCLADLLRS
jgi:acetoin utilization protein AcuB